ncbi:hypothetical protein, partial [Candidatus Allofournierella excrementavium]|uniref:hypothetical protein n=1 Tax=Candidatus Allofournierella excrementavium TaxID=2838591 RepID=UPI003AF808A4
ISHPVLFVNTFLRFFEAAFPVTGGCRLPSGGRKTVLYEPGSQKSTPFFGFFEKIVNRGFSPPKNGGLAFLL